jgi:hypothetical protein
MKSLKRIRKRNGRCYELALKAMLDEPGGERFTLVHGRVRQDPTLSGAIIGHAWIETGDGMVYCPSFNRYMPLDEYMAARSAKIERRYTMAEAMTAMGVTGHSGPWPWTISWSRSAKC